MDKGEAKAMKATYELVNKVKSKVSEDAFKDIEEIVNSVCAENNICSRLAYGVGIHDGMELYKELQIRRTGAKICGNSFIRNLLGRGTPRKEKI